MKKNNVNETSHVDKYSKKLFTMWLRELINQLKIIMNTLKCNWVKLNDFQKVYTLYKVAL